MSNTRTNLGFGSELDAFDPSSWSDPPAKTRPAPTEKAATRKVAEAIGFQSREATSKAASEPPSSAPPTIARSDRRRRTGRNAQFNLKVRPETIEAFCRIADLQGWGLGETLERAVILLEREHSKTT
ncbi:MAG: stability/partitioning determinant [Methylocystis silviterrae]